jgi:pSer/pThr/pTyr-binding forkhead associated (FHA) protein
MRAKLISREHGEFAIEQSATIGRAAGNAVVLEASVISTEHARIRFDAQRSAYVLEDLGSLNGTYLDGIRLDREEVLGKLHVIRFGDHEDFVYQLVDAEPGAELDTAPEVAREPETIGLPASGKTQVGGEVPVLPAGLRDGADTSADTGGTRVEQGVVPIPEVLARAAESVAAEVAVQPAFALEFSLEGGTERFLLKVGENVVGRSGKAEVRLASPDLSRRHATLIVAGDQVRLRDEGSRNHTFVNGQQVDQEVVLPVGAEIVFGRLEARLIAIGSSEKSDAQSQADTGVDRSTHRSKKGPP